MADNNVRITIESEQHYWDYLVEGLHITLTNTNLSSEIRAAVTHFKVKLTNALNQNDLDQEAERDYINQLNSENTND